MDDLGLDELDTLPDDQSSGLEFNGNNPSRSADEKGHPPASPSSSPSLSSFQPRAVSEMTISRDELPAVPCQQSGREYVLSLLVFSIPACLTFHGLVSSNKDGRHPAPRRSEVSRSLGNQRLYLKYPDDHLTRHTLFPTFHPP